jgi:hypothetical protein
VRGGQSWLEEARRAVVCAWWSAVFTVTWPDIVAGIVKRGHKMFSDSPGDPS